jgi:hypothetical protein
MAFNSAKLVNLTSMSPGQNTYRYDTTDEIVPDVEAAGYMNNKDDNLNLAKGDQVRVYQWATAVGTGTLTKVVDMVVTNVIANDAAASAGNVNLAESGVASSGVISSLA